MGAQAEERPRRETAPAGQRQSQTQEGSAGGPSLLPLPPPAGVTQESTHRGPGGEKGQPQHCCHECAQTRGPVGKAHGFRELTCPGLNSRRRPGAFSHQSHWGSTGRNCARAWPALGQAPHQLFCSSFLNFKMSQTPGRDDYNVIDCSRFPNCSCVPGIFL